MSTKIEWCDETWNPTTGCSRVSSGCDNCYAMRMARRLDGRGVGYDGTTRNKDGVDWTGVVKTHPDRLSQPLSWQKPRRVFVCSMSDLFHPSVPFGFVDEVFAVMALCPQHTFQVLTKRPDRMREYLTNRTEHEPTLRRVQANVWRHSEWEGGEMSWPLRNVWLGTSAEDQETLEERWPHLQHCPAAVRFLSLEPLLGQVQLSTLVDPDNGHYEEYHYATGSFQEPICTTCNDEHVVDRQEYHGDYINYAPGLMACPDCKKAHRRRRWRVSLFVLSKWLDWIIVGGESGPGARPMNPQWVWSLLRQAHTAGIAFHFKQWGAWAPEGEIDEGAVHGAKEHEWPERWGRRDDGYVGLVTPRSFRVGKKAAGRTLDGETYEEFPQVKEPAALS